MSLWVLLAVIFSFVTTEPRNCDHGIQSSRWSRHERVDHDGQDACERKQYG